MQIVAQSGFFPHCIDCHTDLHRCFAMALLDKEETVASEPTFFFMENLALTVTLFPAGDRM